MNLSQLHKPIIATLHLLPLPGSYSYKNQGIEYILERAMNDVQTLSRGGVDAIILQNNGDGATSTDGHIETVAYLTMIATHIKREFQLPLGINILFNGTENAISVAHAVGASFVRIKVLIGAVVSISGVIQGSACRAQEFIRKIGASNLQIIGDVYDRSSSPLGGLPIEEAALQVVKHGKADGIIVAGLSMEDSLNRLRRVKLLVKDKPVYVGGGTNSENIETFLSISDGAIVGKSIKSGDDFSGLISIDRLKLYMDIVDRIRR